MTINNDLEIINNLKKFFQEKIDNGVDKILVTENLIDEKCIDIINTLNNLESILKCFKDDGVLNNEILIKTFSLNKHDTEIMNAGIQMYIAFEKIYNDESDEKNV